MSKKVVHKLDVNYTSSNYFFAIKCDNVWMYDTEERTASPSWKKVTCKHCLAKRKEKK